MLTESGCFSHVGVTLAIVGLAVVSIRWDDRPSNLTKKKIVTLCLTQHEVCREIFMHLLWSTFVPLLEPAAVLFHLLHKGLKQ
jgi:hypothetical protein